MRRSTRSARPRPHPPCGHLLPQAGEGRDLAQAGEVRGSVWLGRGGMDPPAGHLQCAAASGWRCATS
ncbi:FHA domain-containing protein (fragment) [Xanthomonas citri pv. fuscans]